MSYYSIGLENPFKLMCNASDKVLYAIYYANKTLDDAKMNYAITKRSI